MATIVFSHGFGVKANARGLFSEIANAQPEHRFILFDYNEILDNGDIEVAPLDIQAIELQQQIDQQIDNVIVIAHSQGCVVAGLVNLQKVQKVILLAPPTTLSMQRIIDRIMKRPGAQINLDGISKLPRTDGTTTHISSLYLKSLENFNPLELYNNIAKNIDTTIVRCTNDEVLGLTDVDAVPNTRHIDIESDHDFTGNARKQLLSLLKAEINL